MTCTRIAPLVTACVLAWYSEQCVARGELVTIRPKDVKSSSPASIYGVPSEKTADDELTPPVATILHSEVLTTTPSTANSSISPTVTLSHIKMSLTCDSSPLKLPANEATVLQSSTSAQEYDHHLSAGDITPNFASESPSSTADWIAAVSQYSRNLTISHSRMTGIESFYSSVLTSHVDLIDETILSSSFVLGLYTSSVHENFSADQKIWSEQQTRTFTPYTDIQLLSTITILPTSLTFVASPSSSAGVPTTRSTTRTAPGKPSRTGATGEKSNIDLSGGITPGAKIAVGIVVTLCILCVVVAGVVTYRRYSFTHKSLKSFLTSDVRYKTYNNTTYKDDEVFPGPRGLELFCFV